MSGIGQAGMREDGKPGVGTVQAQMHGDGKPGGGTVQAQMHGDGKPGGGTVQDKRPRNGARKPGKSRKGGILPGLCSALSILLLVTVVGLCIPMIVPRLFGYEVYTVVSGSMEPAIPVGSAIYLQAVAPETVTVGEPDRIRGVHHKGRCQRGKRHGAGALFCSARKDGGIGACPGYRDGGLLRHHGQGLSGRRRGRRLISAVACSYDAEGTRVRFLPYFSVSKPPVRKLGAFYHCPALGALF